MGFSKCSLCVVADILAIECPCQHVAVTFRLRQKGVFFRGYSGGKDDSNIVRGTSGETQKSYFTRRKDKHYLHKTITGTVKDGTHRERCPSVR